MIVNNYILEYYQGISNGSIVVGKWVKLLYEKIVDGLDNGTYHFDQHKADKAIGFIETFCRHNKGELAPGQLKLSLWQKAMVSLIFGIVDADGLRQFNEVFCVVGRKCGKTLLAAGIMSYMFYAGGEYGQEIYCLAPKLEQSDLVYSAFEFNVDHNPTLAKLTHKRGRKQDIFYPANNSFVKKIAFAEKRADGYNPQLTICDELSSWTPPARSLRMYEVMVSGTGARKQPLTLSITSGGYVNDGIYDELLKRSTRFLMDDGNSKEQSLLPLLYIVDDIRKWNDINELRKSLPGLGVSVSTKFLLKEIAIAEGSLSKKAEFLCKYACVKQNSSQAWLDAADIEAGSGDIPPLEDWYESYAVAGIDLSRTTDLTSACIIIEKAGELYVYSKSWLPRGRLQEAEARDGVPYSLFVQQGWLDLSGENFVDYHDCFNWFRQLIEEYKIYPLVNGYDRYSAQYLIQDMEQYGFVMDDVKQGENLTGVLDEMQGLFADHKVHIGNNAMLQLHLLNAAVKINAETERRKLIKLSGSQHIDACAALADAFCVRQKWYDQYGSQLRNEG